MVRSLKGIIRGILLLSLLLISTQITVNSVAAVSNASEKENVEVLIQRTKKLIEKDKPVSESAIIKVSKKTETRIVQLSRSLSDEEKKLFEIKYQIKFTKKSRRGHRYSLSLDSEQKYEEFLSESIVTTSFNNDTYKVGAQVEDWGISYMNIPYAWSNTPSYTGSGIVVAVIDTGIQLDHPDLLASIQSGGYDFINNDADPSDDNGHGTHISGTIVAINNTDGIIGAAYGAKVLPLKACNSEGLCDSLAIADAIDEAVIQNVDVINMSFSGSANALIQEAINSATSAGIIVAAAAGNYGSASCLYPAAYSNVVCVGAVDSSDLRPSFGNYGTSLEVVAPGVSVLSTSLGGLTTAMSGTSMSTAYYSGAAAIVKGVINDICTSDPGNVACADKRAYVQTMINRVSVRDIGTPGYDTQFGYGAVDLSAVFTDTTMTYTQYPSQIALGATYSNAGTLTNNGLNSMLISSCTVKSDDLNRTETSPVFEFSNLVVDSVTYSSPVKNIIYTTFNFVTPLELIADGVLNFSYNYTLSTESVTYDTIAFDFVCKYDDASTGAVEVFTSDTTLYSTKVDVPTSLKNVYFTFGSLRYKQYVYASQVRAWDRMYLKNYNPSVVRFRQFFLFDYAKSGTQGYTKYAINYNTYGIRTNYLLAVDKKYAYVAEFEDIATGVRLKKYFPFYIIGPNGIPAPTPSPTPTPDPTPTPIPTPTPTPPPEGEVSDLLKNVYFTFGNLRYNSTVYASQVRAWDRMYLKNFNPSQLRFRQFFLFDYEKRGTQGYTKYAINYNTYALRTNYFLPRGKKYAYVAEFEVISTGERIKKYFPFYVR